MGRSFSIDLPNMADFAIMRNLKKLMHEGLQTMNTICVDTVVFNLHRIKEKNFFSEYPVGLPRPPLSIRMQLFT